MEQRPILGLTEIVTFIGKNGERIKTKTRIDTGATSSSIDKTLAEKLQLGPIIHTRTVRSASGTEQRPMVHARIIISNKVIAAEFSIAERGHMTYNALIGQNILKKEKFLIDPLKE